jgi:O-antigen/teichoic acid export membrane protein
MGVSFASLSRLQGDDEHFHDSARKIFLLWGFVMWPVMFGLICVAGDMFRFLLPEVWMPTVPYIQILSLAGLLAPLSVISYNIVKIKSDGNMIFRIEVVKKAIATIVLIITIPISVKAIAWGQVIIFVSDMLVNALTAHRYSPRWTLWARTKDLLPYIFATGVMVGVLAVITLLTANWAAGWVLLVKVLAGVIVYCGVNALFRFEAWQEMMTILKGYVKKN